MCQTLSDAFFFYIAVVDDATGSLRLHRVHSESHTAILQSSNLKHFSGGLSIEGPISILLVLERLFTSWICEVKPSGFEQGWYVHANIMKSVEN